MLRQFSSGKHNGSKENSASDEKIYKSEVKVTGIPPIAIKESKKDLNASQLNLSQLAEKQKIGPLTSNKKEIKLLATYNFISDNIPITIRIYKQKGEFVPIYDVSISSISKTTELLNITIQDIHRLAEKHEIQLDATAKQQKKAVKQSKNY